MDLQEQIRYYSALASHYRALNYRLNARYQILYASPLQDYKKGLADIANEIYAERWEQVNQSLQTFHDTLKRRYLEIESRKMEAVDLEAIRTKYRATFDQIVTY